MRYSEDLIEEVRSRNDIVDVVSGYVKLTRKGSNYFGSVRFTMKSPLPSRCPEASRCITALAAAPEEMSLPS